MLQFQDLRTLPVGVYIISTKHHCILKLMSNLHPKLYLHCITLMLIIGSLDYAVDLLSVLQIAAELLPSRLVNEVIIMCILGKVYWVIAPHPSYGIPSDRPTFPIDQNFIA